MPRRNRTPRRKSRGMPPRKSTPATPEALARSLVLRGLVSTYVLDKPWALWPKPPGSAVRTVD